MRPSFVLPVLAFVGLASAGLLEKRAAKSTYCSADNCLRALTGTGSNGGTSRPIIAKADCSSYLSTLLYTTVTPTITFSTTVPKTVATTETTTATVTTTFPATATSTATATVTSDEFTTTVLKKRSASSGSIPTYASACSGAVRYSSACSCFGVLPSISTSTIYISMTSTITYTSTTSTTLISISTATASVTSTTTDTATTTTTVVLATCTSFGLETYEPDYAAGDFVTQTPGDPHLHFSISASIQTVFSLNPAGQLLLSNGNIVVLDTSSQDLYSTAPNNIPAGSYAITCQLDTSNHLTCQEGSFVQLEIEQNTGLPKLALSDGSLSGGINIGLQANAAC